MQRMSSNVIEYQPLPYKVNGRAQNVYQLRALRLPVQILANYRLKLTH